MEIKYNALKIIEKAIYILSFRKKILLPTVAELWKPFQLALSHKLTKYIYTLQV